jgi:hypothetical protein
MAVTAFTNYWRSFGFTEEDPEFIVNYHKYRMGLPRRRHDTSMVNARCSIDRYWILGLRKYSSRMRVEIHAKLSHSLTAYDAEVASPRGFEPRFSP